MNTHTIQIKYVLFAIAILAVALGGLVVNPTPAAAGLWWAEYYANQSLDGSPTVTRYDDAINFTWGSNAPADGIPVDHFSVRWTRDDWFTGGTYRFTILSDDGIRIWVGDQLIVDEWRERWATPLYIDHYIPQGTHTVRVEYFDNTGDATASIGWSRITGGATWRGEYYDNQTLGGSPILVRDDGAIDFNWGGGSPDPSLPNDGFSVRWLRSVTFSGGTYRFYASTDDGVQLWVDSTLVIDAWRDRQLPNTSTGELYLSEGTHTITVEYYENGGGAHAHVWWETLVAYSAWHGEYFDNPNLVGGPVLERDDPIISFDWGTAAPVTWMPDDNFSARWTRIINFDPGYYRFAVLADDGVRLWIDQSLLIDRWQDMDYELHYVDGTYLEGPHTIRLEYYERNGNARVRMWWEDGTTSNAPPTSIVGPTPPDDDPWAASYFATPDLSGEPVLTRIETSLDHAWGTGSPGTGVPADYFSARWTQPLYFAAGTYQFTTYTDDGVRLWIDGRLMINGWVPMAGHRSTTIYLAEGVHDIRMEYYERTGQAQAHLYWRRVSD